jgi:sugar lactone lactonase YvrE
MQKHIQKLVIFGLLTSFLLAIDGCGKRKETEAPAESATPKEQAAPATAMPKEQAAPATAMPSLPDVISFTKKALYPEGVDYDTNGKRFLVTSLHEGTVGTVSPDGNYQVLFQDSKMVSAIGIRIDSARDRVLVCNSDPGASIHTMKDTQGKLAGVAAFQLSTGKLIKYIDLASLSKGGGHFCNDIAIDSTGTAYVTDSFSPIIYKIDPDYNASIFLQNDSFTGKGFNLNGIVVKDDYLVVAKSSDGELFKVPLNDPEKFSKINIAEKLPGADGLLWGNDGSLIVIAHEKVFKLGSTDNWTSATIANSVDTGQVYATTGVKINGDIYVLYAMLHVLFNPESKEQVEKFEIHKVNI